jgi:hypothetical protein
METCSEYAKHPDINLNAGTPKYGSEMVTFISRPWVLFLFEYRRGFFCVFNLDSGDFEK